MGGDEDDAGILTTGCQRGTHPPPVPPPPHPHLLAPLPLYPIIIHPSGVHTVGLSRAIPGCLAACTRDTEVSCRCVGLVTDYQQTVRAIHARSSSGSPARLLHAQCLRS